MLQWSCRIVVCINLLSMVGSTIPSIPMLISGNVSIDGEAAPIGTEIKAIMGDKVMGSITVSEKGGYAMIVENRPGSKVVEIYVNGIRSRTIDWSNEPGTLDLTVSLDNFPKSGPVQKVSQGSGSASGISPAASPTVNITVTTETAEQNTISYLVGPQRKTEKETVQLPGFDVVTFCFTTILTSKILRRGKN